MSEEAWKAAEPKPDQVRVDRDELMALCERCVIGGLYDPDIYARARQMLLKVNPQSTVTVDRSASSR